MKDNIEKLFEQRLGSKQFVFRESDWEKMSQKLDANPATSGYFANDYNKWITFITAVSIAFLLGWFSKEFFEEEKENSDALITSTTTVIDANESLASRNTIGDNDQQDRNIYSAQAIDREEISSGKEADFSGKGSDGNESGIGGKAETGSTYTDNPREGVIGTEAAPVNLFESKTANDLIVEEINRMGYELTDPYIFGDPELQQVHIASAAAPDEEKQEEDRKESMGIGVTYAPDITGSGFLNGARMAQSFGLQFYYPLISGWTLSSGVNYVKKKYDATAEEYQPYEGYWDHNYYGQTPESISGHCGVIDIPINISRTWRSGKRISFLTTVGLSNYILLNEGYSYSFSGAYPMEYEWESQENSKVIAGILNTSIGVSIKMNDHIHFIAEPYLKIPLEDIGFGKLRLFSTGTAFTIRYNLNK